MLPNTVLIPKHLLFGMILNSLVIYSIVTACMKMVPIDGASIREETSNIRRAPTVTEMDDDYIAHVQKYRSAAKTFSTGNQSKPVNRQPKVFSAKTDNRSDNVIESTHEESNVQKDNDDQDLFDALRVEKPDICLSCPELWMNNDKDMKEICSNFESVSSFFSMTLDKVDAKKVEDESDIKECTRTITCSQPHMLVKWQDSDLCDVHAPSSGSNVADSTTNTFVYKCNGTQWTMHGFPLSSVVCAVTTK